MMEFLALALIIIFAVIILKVFVHLGIFMITLPFKILSTLLSIIIVGFIMIPLGIVGGLAALIAIPIAILIPLIPIVLILWGVFLLGKSSK
jgi:hypothetical protein